MSAQTFFFKLLLPALLLCTGVVSAQTNVASYEPVRYNGEGIVYALPQTRIVVRAQLERTIHKPGPLHLYAQRYFGQEAGGEPSIRYRLGRVIAQSVGIPDFDQKYIVEFRAGTVADFVTLNKRGIIVGINADRQDLPSPCPDTLFRLPTIQPGIEKRPALPQEYTVAGTKGKQAEIAAAQVFRIRESLMDLLTGQAENMPKDGAAMQLMTQELKAQETALLELFYGKEEIAWEERSWTIEPKNDIKGQILFRFSPLRGVVDSDDLSGEPVSFSLRTTDKAPEMDEKEAAKYEKSLKGIVYNLPGAARITLEHNRNVLFDEELPVTQFGRRQALAPKMFRDRGPAIRVVFDENTGAIRQINENK
ncbi:hypothetical protein HMPREF1322_1047 [Porphyromonas gingivalis W50]|nr:DUF4831 family protein [Porphyromonas gingivalis]AKV65128.1 hypothetical protein PGA7_00019490 [Porphyromonas gingivalis]AUR46163.1 hypothetical protein CF003_2083 [Porphyromonas gingivalis]EIW94444.1 hypothetical protein HMPREF1322_1047 [Porphyromonas gingivalis W50]USI93934.1 DUF4831 family protein [Porphyromonas gingivalis]USI95821.1 DUF4831 family protein [Porphyromonas gingivalis]